MGEAGVAGRRGGDDRRRQGSVARRICDGGGGDGNGEQIVGPGRREEVPAEDEDEADEDIHARQVPFGDMLEPDSFPPLGVVDLRGSFFAQRGRRKRRTM